ncbi:Peptide methionine sulfoxide reductase A5 [Dendrobium catenatum]|uniref:peptide-methionine (S)-S-oxide reductase n=1 Tax=Dendrobium catenatum TaxID=906689 RepID=A0A2I0WFY4_9ASPA|nr:Peptide methionine sulfoxide reductase A5 [Dendrobium catenatum]
MYRLLSQSKAQHIHGDNDRNHSSSSYLPQAVFLKEAIFAAGSFWELEAAICRADSGAVRTAVGYFGGTIAKPIYNQRFGASTHHRSAIFYATEEEKKQAQESKVEQQMKLNRRIVTKITPASTSTFYLAESQNQKYYLQESQLRLCECLSLRSAQHFADSYLALKLNG